MSLTESTNLLREYAERGDEAAFRELVGSYIDLVYSTAVRRLGGDAELARDVTQTVFSDLARNARSLLNVRMLGGWLHRHTGFVAAKAVRAERRRQAREREAAEMSTLQNSADPLWQQLAPVLDESIDSLEPSDREAILLRFFERRDFRSVGSALGISDDAAQKRVSRALEKLRALLTARGITLTVPVLAGFMAGKVIHAAPIGLATQVCTAVLAGATGVSVAGSALAKWASSTLFKSIVAITAVTATFCLVLFRPANSTNRAVPQNTELRSTQETPSLSTASTPFATDDLTSQNGAVSDRLTLRVVAADTGEPVPGAAFDCILLDGTTRLVEQYEATRSGILVVPVPRSRLASVFFWSKNDGFADTWLHWRTNRGDTIPDEYTLRLARAVPIGGYVLDPDDRPVAGAHVFFAAAAASSNMEEARPEKHADSGFATQTDAQGRWTLNRIAPEVLRRLDASVTNPEFSDSVRTFIATDPAAERELLAGTYVFRLERGLTLSGSVWDSQGQPVPNAIVRAMPIRTLARGGTSIRTTNRIDGSFTLSGCRPGDHEVSVEADGFAITNFVVTIESNSVPLTVTLHPGNQVRLIVVSENNMPIRGAHVVFRSGGYSVIRETDSEGRVAWNGVPASNVDVSVSTPHAASGTEVEADGQEHVITLKPRRSLILAGIVRDAENDQPIRHFRIRPVRPVINVQSEANAIIPWIDSESGEFRQEIKEDRVAFKFEAEGYAPFITRTVRLDEGEARFDIALRPAAPITVTVLDSDGQPAVGADVGIASRGTVVQLIPGGLSRDSSALLEGAFSTDAHGQFALAPDETIDRVIVANHDGYAEAGHAQLMAEPIMRLEPWGRIEGTFLSAGKPAPDRTVEFRYALALSRTIFADWNAYQAQTDEHGRFVFPKVPPGKHTLVERRRIGRVTDLSGPAQMATLADVEVRPEETTFVTIGASNHLVSARLRWPVDLQRQADWQVSAVLHIPPPVPPVEVRNDREAMAAWRARPEVQAAVDASRRRYQFTENPENVFTADNVAPGAYTFLVSVLTRTPDRRSIAVAQVPVTIPASEIGTTLDLGEIELRRSTEETRQ